MTERQVRTGDDRGDTGQHRGEVVTGAARVGGGLVDDGGVRQDVARGEERERAGPVGALAARAPGGGRSARRGGRGLLPGAAGGRGEQEGDGGHGARSDALRHLLDSMFG